MMEAWGNVYVAGGSSRAAHEGADHDRPRVDGCVHGGCVDLVRSFDPRVEGRVERCLGRAPLVEKGSNVWTNVPEDTLEDLAELLLRRRHGGLYPGVVRLGAAVWTPLEGGARWRGAERM